MKYLLIKLNIILFFSSCATLITGNCDNVYFETLQPGAKIYLNDSYKDVTPCVIKIPRKQVLNVVKVEKDSFETKKYTLPRKFNNISFLNSVFVPFWAVDIILGNVSHTFPKQYKIELVKLK